jgi:hypothetical protein
MLIFVQRLRKDLRIDYTGGDSNTFIFKARDRSRTVARSLAQGMVDRLRYVWVTERRDMYSDSLKSIAREIPEVESERASLKSRNYLRNTYNGMLVASLLSDTAAARNFQLVKNPSLSLDPLWPRACLLVPIGGLTGLLAGLFLLYLKTVRVRR